MRPEITLARARLGFVDFGLSALASALTVYSLGMGLNQPDLGRFFMMLVIGGSLFSFLVHRILPEKSLPFMGVLYALVTIAAFAFRNSLNNLLPGDGVPPELIVAGALAWMLALGSFFIWQDASMMFQSVPSVALFGLIGAWDTFREAPIAFFGFLMCFATMFSRAHVRLMVAQAGESGFAHDHEGPDSLVMRLREGPWRFVAGPAWALISALAVVVVSSVGAPVIKSSVEGVARGMNFPMPNRPNRNMNPLSQGTTLEGNAFVGRGPRTLRNVPFLYTNLTTPSYLRGRTYRQFTKDHWTPVEGYADRMRYVYDLGTQDSLLRRSAEESVKVEAFGFKARFQSMYNNPGSLPAPGYPAQNLGNGLAVRPDGTVQISQMRDSYDVDLRIPVIPETLTSTAKNLAPYFYGIEDDVLTTRTSEFVAKATEKATTDYEKAIGIKMAIEGQVGYDLSASEVPEGLDPVDFFLFTSKRGYCDLFATAMTRCARSIGLPARYVTGYYPATTTRDDSGHFVILESEAHAWCEIFFEGAGWVVMDATEGAPNVGDATDGSADNTRNTIGLVFGGLSLIICPYYIYRWYKAIKNPVDPVKRKLGKAFGTFTGAIEKKTRKPRKPSQTPLEYVNTVQPLLGESYESALALSKKFERAFYGPDQPDWAALETEAKEFAKSLRR